MLKTLVMTMKYRRHFDPHLREIAKLLINIDQRGEIDYVNAIMTYIVDQGEAESPEEFVESLFEVLPKRQVDKMQSIAQHFIDKGRYQGVSEGREEGRTEGEQIGRTKASREIARKMLANQVDIHIVMNTTGLSFEEIKALQTD